MEIWDQSKSENSYSRGGLLIIMENIKESMLLLASLGDSDGAPLSNITQLRVPKNRLNIYKKCFGEGGVKGVSTTTPSPCMRLMN
jgi:hypothetical protein